MSKKKNKKSIKESNTPLIVEKIDNTVFGLSTKLQQILLFVFAFLLYANTLTHEYTQDDAIVIYDNMYTQQGFAGIPGLLTKDTFFGFFKVEGKDKLVSGGRYRPLTPIMFAVEWQLFGRSPFIGHLLNALYFALLCLLLYKTLSIILLNDSDSKYTVLLVWLSCLIFAAHPIHTEVVANIKGRDEIMSLMGALFSLFASFKYDQSKRKKWILFGFVSFFLALMSKENAITYLAVIPLAFMIFRKKSLIYGLKRTLPFVVATILFLAIRTAVLGIDFGGAPMELMNNPYIKIENNSYVPFSFEEKTATVSYTLGKYIQLLIIPHPLTHDYYPRHIDIMHFSDWEVLLSILIYLFLIFSIFYYWKKNKLISFCSFYFLATLSIVSNVVFPIGTNMSERFAFMPSLGFALLLGYLLSKLIENKKHRTLAFGLSILFLLGFSTKTISRNFVWKDDYTLFTTDVHTSKKSAKMLNAAGGALSTSVYGKEDGPEKTKKLNRAIGYLKEAIKIHPQYKNAYLLLGNAHYFLKKYEEAISYYDYALQVDPSYPEAMKNLSITLRDAGRYYGEKVQDFSKAEQYLLRSYELNKTDFETVRLLGITYGLKQDHRQAIRYFEEALKINPEVPNLYASLGTAYMNYGDEETARMYFQKAEQMDPNVFNRLNK